MNTKSVGFLIGLWSGLMSSTIGAQQDINFDDLQRQGKPLVKTLVVEGVGREGSGFIARFSETDDDRIAERARYAASSSSSSSSNASSSGSSSGSRGQEYVCKFTCYAINSGVFTNKSSGGGTVSVRAESYSAAKGMAVDRAKSLCSGSTLTKNPAWGGDSVDCSRK